jgi:sarcosine oxidase subunit delta
MMIDCPHCGMRSVQEFRYRGDASLIRPPEGMDEEQAFADYVYLRRNSAGPHDEHWFHALGCRTWLVVTRDTRSHDILAVRRACDVAVAGADTLKVLAR